MNRYTINCTLAATVSVEAESEEEALEMVGDALRMGDGDFDVISADIDDDETIEDGPAKYAAWSAAWKLAHVACDKHGRDSDEYKAAVAYADSLPSGI